MSHAQQHHFCYLSKLRVLRIVSEASVQKSESSDASHDTEFPNLDLCEMNHSLTS